MSKHTPGPWYMKVVSPEIIDIHNGSGGEFVCTVKDDKFPCRDNILFDANIIAAAPELLEVLKAYDQPLRVAINMLSRGSEAQKEIASELTTALGNAFDAIAKAEGTEQC